MSDARSALCSSFERVERTIEATRPAADSDEIRRLCNTQIPAARRLGCDGLGIFGEGPGKVASWYCDPAPETNPMAVPPAPPGAPANERARRAMCSTIANEEFGLLSERPAWDDDAARRFCDTRGRLAATWNCGEFGVMSEAPGTASHWYCNQRADPSAVPAAPAPSARPIGAGPVPPPVPPPAPPAAPSLPFGAAPAPAPAPAPGAPAPAAPGSGIVAPPAQHHSPLPLAPEATGGPQMMPGQVLQTLIHPTAPPRSSYGPYVELSNPQTGVKAFCRMNLDHQIFVCDTPVHGTFQDRQGNAMICDRASWMCKPSAEAS